MAKKQKTKAEKHHTLSDEIVSELTIDPSVQSAVTVQQFGIDKDFRNTDINYLMESLSKQIKATNRNDLSNLEGMLTGQAYALNAIFNRLTQLASCNMDEHLKGAEILLKLGLRAQSQCRSTIEAISAVKNPPMMGYVKQANIAQGHQQVNNSTDQNSISARENQNPKSKLLEKQDAKQLDTGATSQAIRDDTEMETLGEVHRA